MNYMDYTDDDSMYMFTQGQSVRMNAALSGPRKSLLTSTGLVPPGTTLSGAFRLVQPPPLEGALWMQDNAEDNDPNSNPLYSSDDIWFRNNPDGFQNQDHENPREGLNYIYVRVRHSGSPDSNANSGNLKLYWAKASSSLSWPAPWDGSVTSPALMGGLIGSQPVTVESGSDDIFVFEWQTPNPADYSMFNADKAHFSLLARIERTSTPPFGMTSPETGDLYSNVKNNNNIVWKNILINDTSVDGVRYSDFVIGNFGSETRNSRLVFKLPNRSGPSLFEWGHLLLEFRGKALSTWGNTSLKGEGFNRLEDGRLVIMNSGAHFQGTPLKAREFGTLHLQFVPNGKRIMGAHALEVDVVEMDGNRVVGGQRIVLKTTLPWNQPRWDKNLGKFDGVNWIKDSCCSKL